VGALFLRRDTLDRWYTSGRFGSQLRTPRRQLCPTRTLQNVSIAASFITFE
jgi:hypothetical protein